MKHTHIFFLLFLFSLCLELVATAQPSDTDFRYLELKDYVRIENKKGQITSTIEKYERARFTTSNKLFLAKKSIPYDKFRKIENLKAATILENGQRKSVDYFETKDQLGGMLFYSDSKEKEFVYPNVKSGAIVELSYTEVHSNEIPFADIFQFGSYFPVDKSELTVECSNDVEIGFEFFNISEEDLLFTKKVGKKTTTYTWSAFNREGIRIDDRNESDYESRLYHTPHMVVYLKSYKDSNRNSVKVLGNVDDLYRWYETLISQIDDSNLDEVRSIADNLAEGEVTSRDKARKVFQWVQDNVSYVAFGDGFGGFVPRGAASVCTKKYGDCKDMAHLLVAMLNHLNIDTYHTWIGSRRKPYRYDENPTPFVDDHMIACTVLDGDTIFLDATDSFVNFGYPSSFIQGKEALIGLGSGKYKVKEVPVVPSAANASYTTSLVSVQNNIVSVQEERKVKGLAKDAFIRSYLKEKDEKTPEEFLNNRLKIGNNKTRYENISIAGLANGDSILALQYDLVIENYIRQIGGKIFVNVNFDRALSEGAIDEKTRRYGKKFDHTFSKSFETVLSIPEGYEIHSLPEKASHQSRDFGFEISYTQSDGKITQHKSIYINTLKIRPERFPEWNSFIRSLGTAYKKNLILSPI